MSPGERVAQLVIVPICLPQLEEAEELPPPGERAALVSSLKKGGAWGPIFCWPAPAGGGGGAFRHRPGRGRLWQHRAVSSLKKGEPGGSLFLPGLPQLEEAEELSATARGEGGFGSTGQ